MTTRHSGYVVALEQDIRKDDAEAVIAALRMVRGVLSVTPLESEPAQFIAEARRDVLWQERLAEAIVAMRASR